MTLGYKKLLVYEAFATICLYCLYGLYLSKEKPT